MEKYSNKTVISIDFERLQKQKEFEDRIKEIYNIKFNQKLLNRKKAYFRTVKFLLKNKLNRDVTNEEVFQEMIRMRDAPLHKPQPNIILREKLSEIYGPMTEDEFQRRENIFYQYKTRMIDENPDITDNDVLEYLRRSASGEIRRGKERNELLRNSFKEIYGDLTEEEYRTKSNLFYQYKRKLKKDNPETTDLDVIEFMRGIEERRLKRLEKKDITAQEISNMIKSAQHFESIQNIINNQRELDNIQQIIKIAHNLDIKGDYKLSDYYLDKLKF